MIGILPRTLPSFSRPLRYTAAVASVGLGLAVRWALAPYLGDTVPYLPFFPAVMLAGYLGGLGPGLLATGLSALLGDYLFLRPQLSLEIERPTDVLPLALFICSGVVISLVNGALHRAMMVMTSTTLELKATLQDRESLIDELQLQRERLELVNEQLETQQEELQSQTEELETQSEELRVQNLELLEQHRQRNQFLAMLAHELRNPLAPITVAAELLRQRQDPDPAFARHQEIIARQSHHLARMVDDLLDVSRVTQGKITLCREPVDMADVVEQALQICRPLIQERRHELSVELPPHRITLEGDATRLVQVVCNLLNNAARYTDRGGRIGLTVRQCDSELELRVRDNGRGIAPALLGRVFDLFVQADDSPSRPTGGLGVGLTLVRSLVQQHGGTVRAESAGDGCGSEFIVRLPALPGPQAAGAGALTAVLPRVPQQSARVLVVDDNRDAAETLGELLDLAGYDVRLAFDGPLGLEEAARFRPEVVLMDLGMPGLDGFETARRLRSHDFGREILLIAVTGYGSTEDRRRTREAGFDAHLTKPIDPPGLLRLLRGE